MQNAARLHALRLSEALRASGAAARDAAEGLARRIAASVPDPERARLKAEAVLGRIVGRQALTLAFDDVFRMMSLLFLAALLLVPLCRPAPVGAAPPPDAH